MGTGALPALHGALADPRIVGTASDTASADAERWSAVLEVAAEQLAAATHDSQTWSEEARSRVVERVGRATRIAAAAKAPVLLAQERSGTWRRPGMRSFEAHRAAQDREDISVARREINTARTLEELEGGLEALARGEITPSHAQHLRPIADKVTPEQRSQLMSGEGAAMVRTLAREHDPKLFARKVEEFAARRHPAEIQDAHEAIRTKRFLRVMPSRGGTRIEGFLDPVAGHRFRLAIEAASARPGKDDTRTLGQRNADALEAVAAAILDEGNLSPSPNVPTQVMITLTENTFLDAQAHLTHGTHRRSPRGRDKHDVDETPLPFPGGSSERDVDEAALSFPRVRAQDGPLLPPADLGKLLCGSSVGRLVVSAASVPLNAGRTQRTFKNTLRRAVELRDQHCAWPDCHQVARYCKVHHLDWWDSDHGETDVARGILVCEFHHHELHTHNLDLVPIDANAPSAHLGDDSATAPAALFEGSAVGRGDPPGAAPPARLDGCAESGSAESGSPPPRRDGPHSLPGDVDYVPPTYQLVPRGQTADDRRAHLARRMRAHREERLDAAKAS